MQGLSVTLVNDLIPCKAPRNNAFGSIKTFLAFRQHKDFKSSSSCPWIASPRSIWTASGIFTEGEDRAVVANLDLSE